MNKKILGSLFFMAFFFITVSQIAAQEYKFYMGAGVGATEIESDIVLWTILSPDHLEHEERDLGYKFFGGYKINDYLGIELAYIDFGKMLMLANSNAFITSEGVVWEFTQDNTTLAIEAATIGLGLNIFLPLDKIFDKEYLKWMTPFFKFGAHYWNVEKTLSPSNSVNYYSFQGPNPNPANPTSYNIENDSGISLFYGAGFSFNINNHFAIVFAYEWYNIQESMADDIDLISSSIVIKF